MLKIILYSAAVLVLCSSCVSRTIDKEVRAIGGEPGRKIQEKKIIWIWEDEYKNP